MYSLVDAICANVQSEELGGSPKQRLSAVTSAVTQPEAALRLEVSTQMRDTSAD